MVKKTKMFEGLSNNGEESDLALWRQAMKGVKPLSSKCTVYNQAEKPRKGKNYTAGLRQKTAFKSMATTKSFKSYTTGETQVLKHAYAPGLDKRTHQRLLRGKFPIEGRLDLHGHTKESAHRVLDAFINEAFATEQRCVMVITGKGFRINSGDVGVLRLAVPQWLNSPSLRPMILAFSNAIPNDGGEGALYVLLKRKR